jgi:nucleoside-diphosphate-sugar epimerase
MIWSACRVTRYSMWPRPNFVATTLDLAAKRPYTEGRRRPTGPAHVVVRAVGERAVYDEAKRFGEAATMSYRRDRGTDTAIVRIFNTYGPRMAVGAGRAIPTFIR